MEASAELRDRRAFTSMTRYAPDARIERELDVALADDAQVADHLADRDLAQHVVLARWSSVWLGATTMLSPVWIPIGSRFSMLQTVMQLSKRSRTTSYSISFQPVEVLLDQHLRAVGEALVDALAQLVLVRAAGPSPGRRARRPTRTMTG